MHDNFQTPQIQGEGFGSLSCLLVLEMKMIFKVLKTKQKTFTTNGQKLYNSVPIKHTVVS